MHVYFLYFYTHTHTQNIRIHTYTHTWMYTHIAITASSSEGPPCSTGGEERRDSGAAAGARAREKGAREEGRRND